MDFSLTRIGKLDTEKLIPLKGIETVTVLCADLQVLDDITETIESEKKQEIKTGYTKKMINADSL